MASIFTAQTVLTNYNFFCEHPKSFEEYFCFCFGTNAASFVSALAYVPQNYAFQLPKLEFLKFECFSHRFSVQSSDKQLKIG